MNIRTKSIRFLVKVMCMAAFESRCNVIPVQFKASIAMGWTKASDSIRGDMSKIFEKDAGPAGTYYKACMDLDRIDAKGHSVMEPWLQAIDRIHDKDSLVNTITDFNKEGMDVLFEWGIDKDPRHVLFSCMLLCSSLQRRRAVRFARPCPGLQLPLRAILSSRRRS
jgi:hypothetical protein